MRILHVDPETNYSGGEVQVMLLLEGLRARGLAVELACQPNSKLAREAKDLDFQTLEVRMRGDLDLAAVGVLRRSILDSGIDLVHLHTGRANWLGGIAAWRAKRPAVSTRRVDRLVKRNVKTRLIYERFVQHTAAISPAVVRLLTDAGVPPRRISLIWDGIDPDRMKPTRPAAELRTELGVAPTDVVLFAAGSLVRRKGFDILLDAFGRLPENTQLWIAGDGPERDALTAACGPRVQLLGQRDDVPDLLAACDLFVMPSRSEGLGVAALEAMAAGRPVVASRVGGLGDSVIHEQSGLLVPPDNVDALAAALDRIVTDAELRARLSAAGPARVAQTFLADTMVDAYVAMYEAVIKEWRSNKRS